MGRIISDIEGVFRSGDMEGFHWHGFSQTDNMAPYIPSDLERKYQSNYYMFSQSLGEGIVFFAKEIRG